MLSHALMRVHNVFSYIQLCTWMQRVLGNISYNLKSKVKSCISPPKQLEVATSNFVPEYVTCCRGHWATFGVTKVNVKG